MPAYWVQAEAMQVVSQALEAEDVKKALANVDNQLRFPAEAAQMVPQAASATVTASPSLADSASPTARYPRTALLQVLDLQLEYRHLT